jgi:3,4-dihydroxy 2-butanone 4-phosphate synthase / GTP cyclohydrolase II
MSRPMVELELSPIDEVIVAFRNGAMVIMVDDADRENEGDLVMATEKLTPEAVSFMMSHGRGLICVSINADCAKALNLPLQVLNNNSLFQTPFAISVDAVSVGQYGVTASARCETMRAMVAIGAEAPDFVSPGHVFPLIAHASGTIGRQGQTEGSYDLARIAGLEPSGVICEILSPDGTMMRGAELAAYAKEHNLLVTSVEEVMRYRIQKEVLVRCTAQSVQTTEYGECRVLVFQDEVEDKEHLMLLFGDDRQIRNRDVLVRVHSECLTGDVFGSRRCDCGPQLDEAMRLIASEGAGVLIYLRQEGRGIGLLNKLKAYSLQDEGLDTVEANLHLGFPADKRDFLVAAKMLRSQGINSIRLATNNPEKVQALTDCGIGVVERLPVVAPHDEHSASYLETKRNKFGHWL